MLPGSDYLQNNIEVKHNKVLELSLKRNKKFNYRGKLDPVDIKTTKNFARRLVENKKENKRIQYNPLSKFVSSSVTTAAKGFSFDIKGRAALNARFVYSGMQCGNILVLTRTDKICHFCIYS